MFTLDKFKNIIDIRHKLSNKKERKKFQYWLRPSGIHWLTRSSFSPVKSPQLENFFQDFDLEVLDYSSCHLWALIKSPDAAGVVVNRQQLVDLDLNLFWCIAFELRHSNFVEDRILHAFFG